MKAAITDLRKGVELFHYTYHTDYMDDTDYMDKADYTNYLGDLEKISLTQSLRQIVAIPNQ